MSKVTEFLTGDREGRIPQFWEAGLLMILVATVLIYFNGFLKINSMASLFVGLVLCAFFAAYLGNSWNVIEEMMLAGLKIGLVAMIINVLIGMIISTWSAGGTVPYLIYLGLQFIAPQWFLVSTFLLCTIMSACTGSSWATAGTVGVAMFGIGTAMGMPPAMVVGAVLSGSYFGDKMSPVSETTNLAAATAETKLMEHLTSMGYVGLPAGLMTAAIYWYLGRPYSNHDLTNNADILHLIQGIEGHFWLNPILLLPVVVLAILIIKKSSAILAMSIAIFMGVLFSLWQGVDFATIMNATVNGYQPNTEYKMLNSMLNKGGIRSLMDTLVIIVIGLPMGGILKQTKTLETLVFHFKNFTTSRVKVVGGSLITVMTSGAVCGDTYAAYILATSAFGRAYDKLQIDRRILSRVCEMGVVLACLMPWTAGGVFMSKLFGMPPSEYGWYYFWGPLTFFMIMFSAVTGWGIFYTEGRKGWGKNKEIPPILDLDELDKQNLESKRGASPKGE